MSCSAAAAQVRGPSPVGQSDSAAAGTDIGNAGQLTGTGTGSLADGSDDWWVVYPKTPGETVSVTVHDTTPASAPCGELHASLDSANGSAGSLQSGVLSGGTSEDLSASQGGSDRYYVEVTPDYSACTPAGGEPVTYTLALDAGGGGSAPSLAQGSIAPGASIGPAWPPLQGATSYNGTIGTATGDSWFILYKKPDSTLGTIRVENTTVAGSTSCTLFYAALYGSTGTANTLASADVSDNAATTFSVPANEPSDPQGRYYLEIVNNGTFCSSALGETYSIEPGPAAEWNNPARAPVQGMPAGPSQKAAGGPLAGDVTYDGSLGQAASQDWVFFHVNGSAPVTVQVEDVTNSSYSCQNIDVLDSATGSTTNLSDDAASTTVISQAGTFYLEFTVAGGCTPSAPLAANVILTPASGVRGPALTVAQTTLPAATAGKAYSATIGVTGGTSPYAFTAESALPTGLSLNPKTGVISGTPTTADTYRFMVKITDSATPTANSVTDQFTITVSPAG